MDNKQEKYQTAYPDTYNIVKEYARENRKYQTTSEAILWETIRKNQLGVKFRRQHIIGDYIADFICLEKRLIIEIDGNYRKIATCYVANGYTNKDITYCVSPTTMLTTT